ncbi:MAG: protein-disulfide reductase DsbD [Methylococcaceae bacterium]
MSDALAIDSSTLLSDEQAFKSSYRVEQDAITFSWDIADGYHLYRKRIKFASRTPGVEVGQPEFPPGETVHDAAMGDMDIYHGHIDVRVPLSRSASGSENVTLEVSSQGCAEAGVCYPPQKKTVKFQWRQPGATVPAPVQAVKAGLGDVFKALGLKPGSGRQDGLLPPDEAFRFFADVRDGSTLRVSFQVAEGYYLYREKFGFTLPSADGAKLAAYDIPHGEPKHDPEFGSVEVFHQDVGFVLPLARTRTAPMSLELRADFQGCAERGVCYPPMQKTVTLELPEAMNSGGSLTAQVRADKPVGECEAGPATGFVETAPQPEHCQIAAALKTDSIWLTAASFLGMGLLLAFTPCIFPMIPILSGIIVGHGHRLTTGRAFLLSLSYVVCSALAYTVFGVLAGLFGSNLQAVFQEPAIIIAFSALFVVLALSMFGLFTLQVPAFLQSKIAEVSHKQHGGTLLGAGAMGMLSALIVGPCVAAPLAGALIYIGQTGDAWLGGIALFSLGMGMGLPLLAIGASAGKFLPRAGEWMNAVKAAFGVGLLAIAIWLLERLLPPAMTLLLWALLLMISAVYLGALDALPSSVTGWRKLWKGSGIAMLTYGILLLIGVASNSTDPLQPLRGLRLTQDGKAPVATGLDFKRIESVPALKQALAGAAARGQVVMLDFYADWCVSCKEMERYTFTDPRVIAALSNVLLLKADVTENNEASAELLQAFNLIGPPATLFFGGNAEEQRGYRVIGYMEADDFVAHIQKVLR